MLEVLAGLLAGLVILTVAAIWRLSSGPIPLDFLTPSVEEALNRDESPVKFVVGRTVLTWAGWERAVDIVAQDITISPRELGLPPLAKLPEVSVGFSLEALKDGVIAPTTLELMQPKLTLQRYTKGDWGLMLRPDGDQENDGDGRDVSALGEGIRQFASGEGGQSTFGYLKNIRIVDASLQIIDQPKNAVWEASGVQLDLSRTGLGIALEIAGLVQLEGQAVDLSLIATKSFGSESYHLTFDSPYLDPSVLRGVFPDYTEVFERLPNLSANGDLDFDENGLPEDFILNLNSDIGNVTLAGNQAANLSEEGKTGYVIDSEVTNLSLKDVIQILPEETLPLAFEGLANLSSKLQIQLDHRENEISLLSAGGGFALGEGLVNLPDLYDAPLEYREVTAGFTVDQDGEKVSVSDLKISLPKGQLTLQASYEKIGDGAGISLDGALTDFNFNLLDRYWPEALGRDARNWVVPNMPEAEVPLATISMAGKLTSLNTEPEFELSRMGGEIKMKNSTVDYFKPLPAAKSVDGTAVFGENWFDIKLTSGAVGDIKMQGGVIKITDIGNDDYIAIDLDLTGPFRDTLELIDNDPLKLVSGIGFDPGTVQAGTKGKLHLEFPLINDLNARDITVSATATLSDLIMENAFFGNDVTGKELDLAVDNDGFNIRGDILFRKLPLQASWEESFSDQAPVRKTLTVNGDLTTDLIGEFGYSTLPYLEGALTGKLVSREFRDGSQKLDISMQLADATMVIPPLNWTKPRTFPARLSVEALLNEGRPIEISRLELEEETLSLLASATLSQDWTVLQRASLDQLTLNDAQLTGDLILSPEGSYQVKLEGDRFDLTGVIDQVLSDLELDKLSDESEPGRPFSLEADFGALSAIPNRRLGETSIKVVHDGNYLQRFNLDAKLLGGEPLRISYIPQGAGYKLTVSAENAGSAMADLNLFESITGGTLMISGTKDHAEAPMLGHVEVTDYTLVKAPVMAKVLEFMSLTGILTALTEKGLPFSKFEGDYVMDEGVLELSKARAFSPSIGISISGTYDLDRDQIHARGTVAPAYAINQVLNIIPVVGWLLTGGEDSGLLGANYSVKGPAENPEIAVNALSALTPGVLRKVFDIFPDPVESKPGDSEGGQN